MGAPRDPRKDDPQTETVDATAAELLNEGSSRGRAATTHTQRIEPEPSPSELERAPLEPGQRIADRYRVVRFIAQGGMGAVYEVEDLELRVNVALKIIRPELAEDPRTLLRFRREIQLSRKVTHPNVCRIFDVGRHTSGSVERPAQTAFLTMELLAGESLAQRLRRQGRFSTDEALPLVQQMVAALSAAHAAGIVHRDLKSGNVMLVPHDGGVRAVVTDFGLAHGGEPDGSASVTGTGGVVGSPAYMAPEQVEGRKVTAAGDLYSLGVVLFEMVTGRLPFVGETPLATAARRLTEPPPSPSSLVGDLDPRWQSTILRCLQLAPDRRFASATAVYDSLTRRPARRAPLVAGALAALLLGIGALLALRARPVAPAGSSSGAQPAARRALAVLGFRNLSGRADEAWLSTAFAEMFRTELGAGDKLRAVPGESVARLKKDLALADADTLARDTLQKIRAHVEADYVVLGSYLAAGQKPDVQLRLDLSVQDARSGETVLQVAETGPAADLFALVSRAGARVRRKLGVDELASGEAAQVRATLPANPEAARLYAEGLALLGTGELGRARDLLQNAVALEPTHPLLHAALADAWAQLNFDEAAAAEAKRAVDLSGGLPREQRLLVEARWRAATYDHARAVDLRRSLFTFYPDNLDYGLDLAFALRTANRGAEALQVVAELRRLPQPLSDDPRIDYAESEAARVAGDYPRSLDAAARTIDKAHARGMRNLHASALLDRGKDLQHLGRQREAKTAFVEAEAIYRQLADDGGRALVQLQLGETLSQLRELDAARVAYAEASATFTRIGDRYNGAWVHNSLGNLATESGDRPTAATEYRLAVDLLRAIHENAGVATAELNLGRVLVGLGRLDEAWKWSEEGLAFARGAQKRDLEGIALGNQADLLLHEGLVRRARERLEEAEKICRAAGDERNAAYFRCSLADVRLVENDLPGARAGYEDALAVGTKIEDRELTDRARLALAALLLEEGRPDEAEAAARKAADEWRAQKLPEDEAQARVVLGRALLAENKPAEATAAVEEAARLGARRETLRAQLEREQAAALLLSATGRAAEAKKQLDGVVRRATAARLVGVSLQARLQRARLDSPPQRRAQLAALERAARAQGFTRLAQICSDGRSVSQGDGEVGEDKKKTP